MAFNRSKKSFMIDFVCGWCISRIVKKNRPQKVFLSYVILHRSYSYDKLHLVNQFYLTLSCQIRYITQRVYLYYWGKQRFIFHQTENVKKWKQRKEEAIETETICSCTKKIFYFSRKLNNLRIFEYPKKCICIKIKLANMSMSKESRWRLRFIFVSTLGWLDVVIYEKRLSTHSLSLETFILHHILFFFSFFLLKKDFFLLNLKF